MGNYLLFAFIIFALPLLGAERKFDFSQIHENETPKGFRSTVVGSGKPGDWKVVLDDVAPMLPPLSPQAHVVAKQAVLAQLSQDPTDEHFPLLILEGETFDDFTLTTRFKTVRGDKEQMAGIAFRIQDEKNFYVLRASSLGNTFRFYKVVNGERGPLFGPEIPITNGVWQEMAIECKGTQIRCSLNGQQVIPTLTDSSFPSGRIGFWTKSDSVSYFADPKIVYRPREVPAQVILRDVLKKYPRLLGLKIYVPGNDPNAPRLAASKEQKEVGQLGARIEQDVISQGTVYYGKEKDSVSVVMPLRDRNGEPIAAVRLIMKSAAGQTEENALIRAQPIVKAMQTRIQSLKDLVE